MKSVSPSQNGKLQPGFTLVELLATVAVIGLLTTLLIPTVNSMRNSAQSAKCIGSIRSWGAALQLYTQDNDGKFPDAKYPANTHAALAKYLSLPGNWTPSQLEEKIGCPTQGWKYGFNSQLSGLPLAALSQPSRQIYAMDLCSKVNDNRWLDLTVLGPKVVALRTAVPKPHAGKVTVLYVGGNAASKKVSDLLRADVTRDTAAYESADDETPIGSPEYDR